MIDAETRAVIERLVEALASCHQDEPQREGRKGPESPRQYYDEDIVNAAITEARNLLDAPPAGKDAQEETMPRYLADEREREPA